MSFFPAFSSSCNKTEPNERTRFRLNYKWWLVAMLWLVCFLNYADRQAIYSVFPGLSREFGFDKVQLGLIGSAFMWVYAAGAPIAGFIGDRVRRKIVISAGFVFWSVITVATGWCTNFQQFFIARALEGLGETFYFPASTALMSDFHGPNTRSKALAFHQSSVYIGSIAGSFLAAWFAEHLNWRYGFYLLGGFGIVSAAALSGLLHEPSGDATGEVKKPDKHSPRESIGRLLRNPPFLILLSVFVCANFVATIFLTWTPTFLVEKFHLRLTVAGLSGSVFIHLASAFSVPVGGIAADRLSRRFTWGRPAVQMTGLLIGSTFVFLIGTTSDLVLLLAAMIGFGLCKGLYDSNIFASAFDVVDPDARSTAAGVMNAVGWGGGALGPVAVGWIAKYGKYANEIDNMSMAIAYCGVIYLAGAALLVMAILCISRKAAEPSCLGILEQ